MRSAFFKTSGADPLWGLSIRIPRIALASGPIWEHCKSYNWSRQVFSAYLHSFGILGCQWRGLLDTPVVNSCLMPRITAHTHGPISATSNNILRSNLNPSLKMLKSIGREKSETNLAGFWRLWVAKCVNTIDTMKGYLSGSVSICFRQYYMSLYISSLAPSGPLSSHAQRIIALIALTLVLYHLPMCTGLLLNFDDGLLFFSMAFVCYL